MRPWLLLGIFLAACGGTHPAPGQQITNTPAGPDAGASIHSSQYGCVLQANQDPAACAAKGPGCSLGPPFWCSGIAPPPDWEEQRADQPCECTCEGDRAQCALVP